MSYIFTFIFIIDIGLCVFIGIKKDLWHAVASLISSIVAAIAAFGIAKLLSAIYGEFVSSLLTFTLSRIFSFLNGSEVIRSNELYDVMKVAGTTVFSSVLFIILYIVIYFILKIPIRAIYRKHCSNRGARMNKEFPYSSGTDTGKADNTSANTASRIGAPIIRVIIGFISFVLITSPVSTLCKALDPDNVQSGIYSKLDKIQTIDKLNDNLIMRLCQNAGGVSFFNLLTTHNTPYGRVTPSKELTYMVSFVFDTVDIVKYENFSSEKIKSDITQIDNVINHSVLLAPAVGAIAPAAADSWLNGDSFWNIRLTIPDGRIGYLMRETLAIVSEWDENDVRTDFTAFTELMSLVREKDLTDNHSADYLIEVLADEDYMERLFMTLYGNEDFMELIPVAAYTGTAMVLDETGINLPKEMTLSIPVQSMTYEQAKNEAHIIAGIAGAASDIKQKNGSLNIRLMSVTQVMDLCDAISELKDSYFLNELAPVIVLEIIGTLDFNI